MLGLATLSPAPPARPRTTRMTQHAVKRRVGKTG